MSDIKISRKIIMVYLVQIHQELGKTQIDGKIPKRYLTRTVNERYHSLNHTLLISSIGNKGI